MSNDLWMTLWICMGIQAVFFAFAATFKTDKVTDLSYSLTFVIVAGVLLWQSGAASEMPARMLAAMVMAWGVRLAAYLFRRILHMKRDARFDGIREHFWPFFKFWFFQGLAVWVIMLPVTLWFRAPGAWSSLMTIGALIWAFGLLIEAIADQQKFAHKQQRGAKWTDVGLWKYSRHPNYFGELTCWWGVFVFTANTLAGTDLLIALLGPIAITIVIVFLTGLPQLEASAERKWGSDPGYQTYKRRTSLLVLWPSKR